MNHSNPYTILPQSDIAIQIERLVESIEQCDAPAFRLPSTGSGNERIEPTRLSRYFKRIRQMIDLFIAANTNTVSTCKRSGAPARTSG